MGNQHPRILISFQKRAAPPFGGTAPVYNINRRSIFPCAGFYGFIIRTEDEIDAAIRAMRELAEG